ncbi:uncharacterized protein BKA55DRAFT_176913 [Fusarium redolens]|uniref:Uncharacterized protein n=1 Tax=Fusarium redolens TaxID=48865 RepID=A0A9P9KS17_FUSRE|nr:uncharacterized protein BKA55DRAFT_176913 [Fusarium redolens]KAH7267365.1 hypothetical protein BKA55DRAFT_176913 [Fusarium redolens]
MQRRAASTALDAGKAKSKMFLKRETKWGETYYVVNRWPETPKPPEEHEYFRINDLLLDLDDMFSKHVRPSSEEDEERALKKWSRDNKRDGIQRKLHTMETSLTWSRIKAFEIHSKPSSSWRLGSHDIFSAALRAPSPAPLIDSSKNQQGSANNATAEREPNKLHLISSNNGIPKQAMDDDSLLLRWLQSRTQLSGSGQYPAVSPSHSVQLSAALRKQDSLTSLRRLVSQYLSIEPSAFFFHQPKSPGQGQSTENLSSDLRDACENFLKQDTLQNKHDVLVFLGNLGQRLAARGDHLGGPLCGLGLRLSAEICKPTASKRYFQIGLETGYWTDSNQGSIDILHCLETYQCHFSSVSQPNGLELYGRQELLELLLGRSRVGNHSALSLINACLHECKQETTFEAYRASILLLGHLGTVELLNQEQRVSAAIIQRLSRTNNLKDKKRQIEAILNEAFQSAKSIADTSVVAQSHDTVLTDPSLAGVVCEEKDENQYCPP